ncbi:MAG: hypothetical protein WC683_19575, partial [bacterium]
GRPTGISLGQGAFFSADIYSQNQIERISNNPRFQLLLIDGFVELEIAELQIRLTRLKRGLEGNAGEILRVDQEIAELEEGLGELQTVEENLKAFAGEHGEDAKEVNEQHELKARRDREKRALAELAEAYRQGQSTFGSHIGTLDARVNTCIPHDLLSGPNEGILMAARKAALDAAGEVNKSMAALIERLRICLYEIEKAERLLQTAHQEQEQDFRKVIEAHTQAQAQVAERSRLERLRNDLLAKKRLCDEKRQELRRLIEERDKMMRELSEVQDQRFQLRAQVAATLTQRLAPTIRVTVEQFGSTAEYEQLIADGLKNSGVKPGLTAEKIVKAMSPADFARTIRQRNTDGLMDLAGLTAEQAGKVISALAGTKRTFDIETVELLDLPRIELLDGATYKDSASLSTGQKCTTILPILLLESESPLLIDQPEDNLDNRFIYETVVKSVSDVKKRRQLLFVTHNPNIPVLGDSERIFVLDSTGKQGSLRRSGTVDECREDVETLLEGGREAFKLRMDRYGH